MHTYATTEELERKRFTLKSEPIKEGIRFQVTFHFEIQLQKVHLYQIMTIFSATDSLG